MNTEKIVEYRGCRSVVITEVLKDDNTAEGGYKTGAIIKLAGVAQISKTVEKTTETKHYDNMPAFSILSEGADTITLDISIPDDDVLALINGHYYDETTKTYYETQNKKIRYFALGYILGDTSGSEKFVWRYKGTFSSPDETSATIDNGTGSNNMSLVYTGIYTTHRFKNVNGSAQNIKSTYKRSEDISEEEFFKQVYTSETAAA